MKDDYHHSTNGTIMSQNDCVAKVSTALLLDKDIYAIPIALVLVKSKPATSDIKGMSS